MNSENIIMGVDPGTNIMGYGLIKTGAKSIELLSLGIIHLKQYQDHMLKLHHIFDRCLQLIDHYHPDELAIEAPFYGKNVQSMLKLGRAQGTAIAAALYRNIPIFEYAPKRIKQAITGNGNASKEQVATMLKSLLGFPHMPKYLDATDGLAAAITHHFQKNTVKKGEDSRFGSWQSYISQNKDKIRD
jgi:crossover junction endodeoxyribonuclease RuvC